MGHKKILIVDDSETVRMVLRMVLTPENFVVESAVNGEDGYNKYKTFNPNAIITDFNMPVVNGEEFLHMIRNENKEIPIIFLTTEMEPSLRERILSSGANGWLSKPLKPQAIISMAKDLFR